MDSYRPNRRPSRDRYHERDYNERYRDPDAPHEDYSQYRRNRARSRSPRGMEYEDRDVARQERGDGYYDVTQVYSQYRLNYYTRSDDLRFNAQEPRPFPSSGRPRTVHDNYFEPESFAPPPPPYHGEHDHAEDNEPLTLVLVRSLSVSATEEIFAKGLEKLYLGYGELPETGAKPGSLKRVMIIRDRVTDNHMAFGYAEYHTIRDAQRAVEKADKLRLRGLCTIASRKIEVCFPHMGVFMPAYLGRYETNTMFTIDLSSTQGNFKYKDERYYPSVHIINPESPYEPRSPPKKSAVPKKTVVAADQVGFVQMESKSKKRKAPGTAPLPFLQHWQHKAAELRGKDQKVAQASMKQPATGVNTISATDPTLSASSSADQQTFAHDREGLKACYLCNSKFDTIDGLLRHLTASELHAQYLKDEARVQRGYQRLKEQNIDPASTLKLPATLPVKAIDLKGAKQYRDRAAERRRKDMTTGGAQSKIGDKIASSASSSDNETNKPSYGKGMAMLQKVGWAEGTGLGAGDGITAPIEQNAYVAGVGLGHEGGNMGDAVEEAQRMTRDGGFLEKTKEMARKRYEQLE